MAATVSVTLSKEGPMAGSATPEPKPNLSWKATVAAVVFAVTILTGFGVATATNHEDNFDHSEESHAEDSHAEDSHEGDESHDDDESHDEDEESHDE